jgi:hypothetical protein
MVLLSTPRNATELAQDAENLANAAKVHAQRGVEPWASMGDFINTMAFCAVILRKQVETIQALRAVAEGQEKTNAELLELCRSQQDKLREWSAGAAS